jgi:4-alpha-glucanotransferase
LDQTAIRPGRRPEQDPSAAGFDERERRLISVIIKAVNHASHQGSLGVWGVESGFWDVTGHWRQAPASTLEAVLDAMGAGAQGPPPPVLVTVRLDHPLPPVSSGRLVLEDGSEVEVAGELPPDLTPGYHLMEPRSGLPYRLVASPGRAPMPADALWGFSAQLYAARSRASWGIGDLADLHRIGSWSKSLGAGVVLINPLHASSPVQAQQASPYFPGSRCCLNPIYLAVDEVPGASGRAEVADAGTAGRALNERRLIDRDRIWALKATALEAIFCDFAGDDEFDAYRVERGPALEAFATFCALAERHGGVWQEWPAEFRRPSAAAVGEFASSPSGRLRITYHAWLQWLLDRQLVRASAQMGVVQDLAVGVDPGGADSWIWQETFADGMRIGAPPDEFNTRGQDWCLPALDPWRMRSAGYEPWIESLRAGFRHGYGLRVDHVMGLFRLYWIPAGATPAEGAYVRYPHHDLLNILSLEAHRAGAMVMGEDLGTVENEVRRDLAERQILTYRLWWFEADSPSTWPRAALGAVSTHDLPTVAGLFSGSDLETQRRLGLQPNEEASADLHRKLLRCTGSSERTAVEEVITRTYADLAEAPCVLVAATLEDALAIEERPNMPGTLDEWPNWSIALPVPLEELEEAELPRALAEVLSEDRQQ